MNLRVLGCSGAEFPGHNPTAFLIDGDLLLDAGTIGSVLTEEEQWRIRYILVTHAHLDHIRGIPLLAGNIVVKRLDHTVRLVSIAENLKAIREHLLNGLIWPDFSVLPSVSAPALVYEEIEPGREATFADYAVTAYRVNHPVPAVGYHLRKDGRRLVCTGDTGPTDAIWKATSGADALIVEVSLPNDMEEPARLYGHLTPELLRVELKKIPVLPRRILVTHLKPQHLETIRAELAALEMPNLELLREGEEYEL